MKHWKKRAVALGLALTLLMTPLASASEAMGWEVQESTTELSVGTRLTKQIFWSDTYSDLRSERYFTYVPNGDVNPTVVYGSKMLNRNTLTAMAQSLESQGRRVIGGINGDLYVMATGAPLGVVVADGVVRSIPGSNDAWYYAVGFREDGTAFIGQPRLSPTVSFQGMTYPLGGGINKIRNVKTNYALLTEDFAPTTQNNEPGIDVILAPLPEGQAGLTIGAQASYVVEQVLSSAGAIPIPAGKVVLTINNKSESALVDALKLVQPGDRVDVAIPAGESVWAEADQAMGGLYRLVVEGKVNSGLSTERTAYSAVGVKADGTAVFYTVDGKQPGHSVGATLTQVAMRLIELGCVEAISLDGGGSTTIGATYPDGNSMGIINKPSDGAQRANSVGLFLTTDLRPSGELAGVYVTPRDNILLSGAKVSLSAVGLDSHYYAMPLAESPSWSLQNGDGMVSADGVFTAGGGSGVTVVTAGQGGVSGTAAVTVVSKPDKIGLTDSATGAELSMLALNPNAKVDLKAVAVYRGLALTSQDECFTWTLDGAVGTVDSQGVLTAGPKSGSGNLTVMAGGTKITIPVSVAGHIKTLEGFEGGIGSMTAEGLTLNRETDSDHVRYGSASLKVSYDAAKGGMAGIVTTLAIAAGERNLSLWVYGDGSQNSLTATIADAQGATQEIMLTGLDFKGWKYVTAVLPEGAAALRSVNLIYGDSAKTAGTFWLDQLTTSNEPLRDEAAPVVTISRSGTQLTAAVSDQVDKKFAAEQIMVTYDGSPVKFTVEGAGTVRATLPAPDGKLHRVAVTVTDASGNIGRAAANIDAVPGRAPVFTDAAGHWAEPFATYLYDSKVSQGIPGSVEGEILFQSDKAITRGELFAMAARWLKLDLAKYADVTLPFADTGSIPDWALPGVRAMYALGYLKGSTGGDGKLYANVGADISRAEAMTILGRVQPRGYAQGNLAAFSDGAQVPDWAAAHLKTLVGQGVVSGGDDGLIRPDAPIKRGEVAKILFSMT